MATAYLETTQWDEGLSINHTYLLEGDKMLAYIRAGTMEPFYFKAPIRIDRRGRKFVAVEPDPFGLPVQEQLAHIREVQGSKGAKYVVDMEQGTCTCPGYTFRGACKHTAELVPA
jgi:hypothetical protein